MRDLKFREEIKNILGGERVSYCFQCGICTGFCPSARFSKTYNPRKIILRSLLGMKEFVTKDKWLWLCTNCYSCEEFCPQNVHIGSALIAVKNIAAEEGNIPPRFIENAKILEKSGRIASLMGVDRLRNKVGLKPIEELDSSDLLKIMKKSGFDKLIRKGGANR